MMPDDEQTRARTLNDALQDELYSIAPDIAPVLLTRDEMRQVIERMNVTVAALAMMLNMDRKTLKTRLDMNPVPLKITEAVKNALGAVIFEEALTEIRTKTVVDLGNGQVQVLSDGEGAQRGTHHVTGVEMYQIMEVESINYTGLGKILGVSPTTVSRGIRWKFYNAPVPLPVVRKLRDYVGHERFDQLVRLLRRGQFEKYFDPRRSAREAKVAIDKPFMPGSLRPGASNFKQETTRRQNNKARR